MKKLLSALLVSAFMAMAPPTLMAQTLEQGIKAAVDADLAGGFAGNTNEQIDGWFDQEITGPWIDLGAPEYEDWLIDQRIIQNLRNERDNAAGGNSQGASDYLYRAFTRGQGIRSSDSDLRGYLGDVDNGVVDGTAKSDFIARARPDVPRYQTYPDVGVNPSQSAIQRARDLP